MSDAPPAAPPAQKHRLWVALVSMLLALVGFVVLMSMDLSDAKLAIAGTFVGYMFGWAGAAVNYYLGSSQGSATKNDDMMSLIRGRLP